MGPNSLGAPFSSAPRGCTTRCSSPAASSTAAAMPRPPRATVLDHPAGSDGGLMHRHKALADYMPLNLLAGVVTVATDLFGWRTLPGYTYHICGTRVRHMSEILPLCTSSHGAMNRELNPRWSNGSQRGSLRLRPCQPPPTRQMVQFEGRPHRLGRCSPRAGMHSPSLRAAPIRGRRYSPGTSRRRQVADCNAYILQSAFATHAERVNRRRHRDCERHAAPNKPSPAERLAALRRRVAARTQPASSPRAAAASAMCQAATAADWHAHEPTQPVGMTAGNAECGPEAAA